MRGRRSTVAPQPNRFRRVSAIMHPEEVEVEGEEDLTLAKMAWASANPLAGFLCAVEDTARAHLDSRPRP